MKFGQWLHSTIFGHVHSNADSEKHYRTSGNARGSQELTPWP